MAYDSYTLATIPVPAGTLTLTLGVDSTLPALTIPARTVLNISPVTERVDVETNVVDLQAVTITCSEDYSTYTAGFWFNVIENYPDLDIELKLVETIDGVDTCTFAGIILRNEISWDELYVSDDTFVRQVRMKFVSNMLMFKRVSIEDLLTEAASHTITVAHEYVGWNGTDALTSYKFIKLRDLFASAIAVAFGQTYAADTVILDDPDIMVASSTGATFPGEASNPMEQYIVIQNDVDQYVGLASLFNEFSFYSFYVSAYELIVGISKMFGYVPKYFYGAADSTYPASGRAHRLILCARGSATESVEVNGNLKSSRMNSGIEFEDISSAIYMPYAPDLNWFWNGDKELNILQSSILQAQIDIVRPELTVDFVFYAGEAIDNTIIDNNSQLFAGLYFLVDSGTVIHPTMKLNYDAGYYNHTTGAWVGFTHGDYTEGDSLNYIAIALSQYLRYRYTPNRKIYDRTYSAIQTLLLDNGTNLVMNPSFEELDPEKTTWDSGAWYWGNSSTGTGSMAVDLTGGSLGFYSMSLTGVDAGNCGGVSQIINSNPNETYVITMKAKVVGAGSPTITVRWNDEDVGTFNPTSSYVEYSMESTGRSGTFEILNKTATQINIDEVAVRLKAGSIVPRISLLDVSPINNGLEEVTYYATEIERDIANNTTRVIWTQE